MYERPRNDDFNHAGPPCDSCGALEGTTHGQRCFYRWVQTETADAEDMLRLTTDPRWHFVQSGPGGTWKVYERLERDGFGGLVARGETLPQALYHLREFVRAAGAL